MEAIAGVNDVATVKTTTALPTKNLKLTRAEFLKILTAQLSNQDPLEPMSNQDFLAQLASMETLEASHTMNESLGKLLKFNQMTAAAGLIGKQVIGIDSTGEPITGRVDSVVMSRNGISLMVGDKKIALDRVTEIQAVKAS